MNLFLGIVFLIEIKYFCLQPNIQVQSTLTCESLHHHHHCHPQLFRHPKRKKWYIQNIHSNILSIYIVICNFLQSHKSLIGKLSAVWLVIVSQLVSMQVIFLQLLFLSLVNFQRLFQGASSNA